MEPAITASQMEALRRLWVIANGDSWWCESVTKTVAKFLLCLYNGNRFPFDLREFRYLESTIFMDCLIVMKMAQAYSIHELLELQSNRFEDIARAWRIPDREMELRELNKLREKYA